MPGNGPYTILAREQAQVGLTRTWKHRLADWLIADYVTVLLQEIEQLKRLRGEDIQLIQELSTKINNLNNRLNDAMPPQPADSWASGRALPGNGRRFVGERPRNPQGAA